MKKTFEYVVSELNKPSEPAVRTFHEHIYKFLLKHAEDKTNMKGLTSETSHITQKDS